MTAIIACARLGAIAGIMLAGCGNVQAQSNRNNEYGGGSRLQPRAAQIVQSGPAAAQSVLQAFGACIAKRRRSSTEKLLQLPIDAPEYEPGKRRLFTNVEDACLGGDGSLQFSDSLLRGALFEELYRRKFANGDIGAFGPDFNTNYADLYARPLSEPARQHVVLQQFAECVAKSDAASVRQMIFASPGTAPENVAISALSPKFSSCFTAGTSLKMTKPSLRAMLAEALYRMSSQLIMVKADQ